MDLHLHTSLFVPGADSATTPLVLLHGSGGDEHDLVPLAAELSPGSPALAIRGNVPFDGGYAFFHRFPDRSIDEADLASRAQTLTDFIEATCRYHSFARAPIAVGFSNGAIMAAALLLTRPGLVGGAILLRPLSPFADDRPSRLDSTPALIIDGAKDSRREPGDGFRLAQRLIRAGASVTHHVLPIGHSIAPLDMRIARDWLTERA